jgi:maltose O-acetyltransferase
MTFARLLWPLAVVYWRLRFAWDRQQVQKLCAGGLRIGRNVVIMPDVSFDAAYPWLIEIGDRCRISEGVRILAHDATPFSDLGVTRLGRVRILHDTFIGERVLILPGVTIGPWAMVAAGSIVSRDVGEGVLVAGNPARVYGRYSEYLERTATMCSDSHVIALDDVEGRRDEVLAAMERGEAFFVKGATPASPYHVNVTDAEVQAQAEAAFEQHFGSRSA